MQDKLVHLLVFITLFSILVFKMCVTFESQLHGRPLSRLEFEEFGDSYKLTSSALCLHYQKHGQCGVCEELYNKGSCFLMDTKYYLLE